MTYIVVVKYIIYSIPYIGGVGKGFANQLHLASLTLRASATRILLSFDFKGRKTFYSQFRAIPEPRKKAKKALA